MGLHARDARAGAAAPVRYAAPGPVARQFLDRWVRESAVAGTPPAATYAAAARCLAPCFGDRPLASVTLGELASLPARLEADGFPGDVAHAICRALGGAIRSTLAATAARPARDD